MHPLAKLDHKYLWHPFTQMRDWLAREPIVIVSGKRAIVRDQYGREYLDANASIWTNLHGHCHPKINSAIEAQLKKIAHSSALGCANEPASLLAAKLVAAANPKSVLSDPALTNPKLGRVFFSDDGSTATEVALKLAHQFAIRTGRTKRPRFLALKNAYHGDTIGAVSLGHVDLFHKAYKSLLFKSDQVAAPYCYRCKANRARPERADSRIYRKCKWECLGKLENAFAAQKRTGNPYAGFVFEPLMQGAAGMIAQPEGWLRQAAEIARSHGAQLIADEVMTGFGRTGSRTTDSPLYPFACHQEGVQPDYLAVAKGLTGGYMPMAATLTTETAFDAFLGDYNEFKTFFHGHSYTANQLGAAAGLASFELLESQQSIRSRKNLQQTLTRELASLWTLPQVGDIRQVGLVAGIELVRNWRTREQFALEERAGIQVCEAMAKRGILTRPIGSIIAIIPPYCTSPAQVKQLVSGTAEAIEETFGKTSIKRL